MKGIIKGLAVLLVVVLALGLVLPVFADGDIDDARDDLDAIKERLEERKKDRDKTTAELKRLRGLLNQLDRDMNQTENDLEGLAKKIREMEKLIDQQEDHIAQVTASITETEEYLEQQVEYLEQRLCAIYKNGTVSYLEVLFSSASFTDFLSRFGFIRTLIESDTELVAQIEEAKVLLQADKEALAAELAQLVERNNELEEDRATVNEKKALLAAKTREYVEIQEAAERELSKQNKDIASLEKDAKEIQALINKLLELARVREGNPPSFFTWPVAGFDRIPYNITSEFGWRTHPITGLRNYHAGVDIARLNRQGDSIGGKPILAAASGTVDFVRSYDVGGYGIYVIISHGGGYQTLYAHMRKVLVKVGDKVDMGQTIGIVGTTGSSTGNHLHFEVWVMGEKKDPLKFVYQ